MRKEIIGTAGLVMMLACLGMADVVSKNVGGFYTVKLNKGYWSMIGINWNAGDGQGILLQDLFNPMDLYPGDGAEDYSGCDQIAYWHNNAYSLFFYVRLTPTNDPAWYNSSGHLVTNKLAPGSAFWFYRPSTNGTLNAKIPGLVDSRDKITFTFHQGYSMVASGFPKDWTVGAHMTNAYHGMGQWDFENCDKLILWDNDAKGWVNYYYCDIGDGPKWLDEGLRPLNNKKLKVGQAGWYFRQAETPLVFDEPNPVN